MLTKETSILYSGHVHVRIYLQISLPFHIPQVVESLPLHISEV